MLSRNEAKDLIKETVTNSITGFAIKSLSKTAKFQILDLIIPKERKIRSVVGGLETSLGTTLWEPLAKALAQQNGFQVIDSNLQCPSNMPSSLNNTLQSVIEDRKRTNGIYDAQMSHEAIKSTCEVFINSPIETFVNAPRGFGVDIWLKKDNVNYFFDTKTVQPNIGTFSKCMEQVLNWYAYFYSKEPREHAIARIVFPYNPNPGISFWDGAIGRGWPLERDNEAWVENQFWDFCSGIENTYELITTSFSELEESGVLQDSLDILFENDN